MRDCFQGHVHNLCRVRLHESCAVKACDVCSAVETVSAVHDVPHAICNVKGFSKHSGRHQAHEIGLNLEIEVVGVRVVEPVAALRRH